MSQSLLFAKLSLIVMGLAAWSLWDSDGAMKAWARMMYAGNLNNG